MARRLPPEAAAAAIPSWSGAFHAIGAWLLREYAARIEDSAARVSLVKLRRPRRLSFRQAEKQAGRPVASITDHPDGSRTFAFGQSTASDAEVNEWDRDLGTHPPSPRQ